MLLRRLVRHIRPVAWRDAKMHFWREEALRLRAELAETKSRSRGPGNVATEPPEVNEPDLVAQSGLFDPEWYLSQLDPDALDADPELDPVQHYVDDGSGRGLSPHPCFDPAYYAEQRRGLKKSPPKHLRDASPLVHYLLVGGDQGLSPHPCFDGVAYLAEHPDSASHPGGPLGHFLTQPGSAPVAAEAPAWSDPATFERAARSAAAHLRGTRGFDVSLRDREYFDEEAEQAFKDGLRAAAPLPEPAPLVSIVLPTRDRAVMVAAAIDSVLAQSYHAWELLVVDDGSTDATPDVLDGYAIDPRVTVLRHEESRGVAAARNTALRAASGRYVAYLDSDNTWRADFLELMVRFLTHHRHRAAYAMSALVEAGGDQRRLYRGMEFSREAIRERNYIDCIVLVHERDLLRQTGLFDERLRRTVDWDLFIRLADLTDFGFAPFVGTEYDVWDERGSRITTEESVAYRFLVYQRTLVDWPALHASLRERREGLLSVVVLAGAAGVAVTTVRRVLATATGPVEVVVVDNHLADAESTRLWFGLHDVIPAGVRVHRLRQTVPLEVAHNVGAAVSEGEFLVFLPEAAWPEPGWDRPLVEHLDAFAAVQPLVLTPGGAVRSAGLSFLPDGQATMPYRAFAGDAPEVRGTRAVDAATGLALAVRARDFVAAEGRDPLFLRHHNGGELSVRVSAATGRPAACVGSSIVALRQDVTAQRRVSDRVAAQDNDRRLADLWRELGDPTLADPDSGYVRVGPLRYSDRRKENIPLVVHDRPDRPLRWAIKIGAPTVEVRTNWGDWHFAQALRDSLERLGHEVTIDCEAEWYRPTGYLDDVVLALRGVSPYEVVPTQTNLLWVISHPERVALPEARAYDHVFGASSRWCHQVSPRLPHPAEPLLQCTDDRRFRPVEPDPERAHEVLVVANARGVRPAVAAALEAGIEPAVYGLRWGGLLPDGAWRGEYLPNEELPAVYAAAGVVLNDHWEDMRQHGIVSNRLFDLVASNARVISDHLPEVEELFGDVVLTYQSAEDLPALVETHLQESPERRQARRELGRLVREHHSFDARAARLSECVLGLRRAADGVSERRAAATAAVPTAPL